MKPESTKFMEAVHTMAVLIPFFPKDEIAQRMIADQLERFINNQQELLWLTATACGSLRDWERAGGLPELRGLFCTRFKPADGIVAYSTTPGYTASDLEARFFTQEREDNDRSLEEYKRERLTAPTEDQAAFPLPKPKLIQ